jgi:hypothetical protein
MAVFHRSASRARVFCEYDGDMIRRSTFRFAGAAAMACALALAPHSAWSETTKPASGKTDGKKPVASKTADKKKADKKPDAKKPDSKKPDAKKPDGKKPEASASPGKPIRVASAGDWGAYTSGAGKSVTCYVLSEPKDRQPASLKRDKGYLFISNRPAESVKNEVAFDMGFEIKTEAPATAEIGANNFGLIAKGTKLWIKNPAEEPQFVEALRKGQKLVVKAQSKKGNASTDTYTLAGVGQMLDRSTKDCQ